MNTLIQFPSGRWARVGPVNTSLILALGYIPNPLLNRVTRTLEGERMSPSDGDELTAWRKQARMLNALCLHCILTPDVVGDDPQDKQISLADIPYGDKRFLLDYLNAPGQLLNTYVVNRKAMWNLYTLIEKTNRRPSDLLKLAKTIRKQFPGHDGWWQCLQFDLTVDYFGRWAEGRAGELDEKGRQVRTLESVLSQSGERKVRTLWQVLHPESRVN